MDEEGREGQVRYIPVETVDNFLIHGSLNAIYHTQLNPTISFLYEPGARRYSLTLDIAEIFKPILADRLIFSMLNRRQIQKSDFDQKLNGCLLKPTAMKKVAQEWEERVKETINIER